MRQKTSKLKQVRQAVVAKVTAQNGEDSRGAFESSTIYRLLVETVRYWLIECFLRAKKLPDKHVYFVYPYGEASIDWGDSPTSPDDCRPLRGKRIRVTIEIENES